MRRVGIGCLMAAAIVAGQAGAAGAQGAADRRSCAARVGSLSVYFDPGSSEIGDASLKQIKEWVAQVRQTGCSYGAVVVEGHRDSVEDTGGGQEVSLRRAAIVAARLTMTGIPQGKIKREAYRAERPFLPHAENGVPANRRARIVFE